MLVIIFYQQNLVLQKHVNAANFFSKFNDDLIGLFLTLKLCFSFLNVFCNVYLTGKIKVLLPAGHVHLVQVNTEQDLLSVFIVSTLAN